MDPATSVYSCDDHLDLYAVPPDVWQSRLPRDKAERGPHVVTRDGKSVWVCEDRVMSRSGIEDYGFRAGTPKLRLEDMDRDGLWVSVIYGPLSLGFPIADPELQSAC